MKELTAQIIGISAVLVFLLSYQMKKQRGIIITNAVSRALYIIQYLLLGAYSGAVLDVLGLGSSVIAERKHTDFIKKHIKFVFFAINLIIVAVGITIAILNKSILDILPIIGVVLHTSAFWLKDEKTIRRVSLLGSPFWFGYNFLSRAYGSAVGDILTMISIVIAMIRYRNTKKEKNSV